MTEFSTHTFAGVDKRANTDAPRSYLQYAGTDADGSLMETLTEFGEAYGIERRPAAFIEGNKVTTTEDYVALVNPARSGQDALWHIATDSYTESGPLDMWGPLVAAARERGHADAFGTARTYRRGGEQRIDVFFGDITGSDPETGDDRFVLGFETGADYFARTSLYGQVIAWDTEANVIMRGLSDRYTTPHRGDAPERLAEWFKTMIDRIERLGDTIYEVVAEAREYEISIAKVPFGIVDWYKHLGLTSDVAEGAGDRITTSRPSAWQLYQAAATTITYEYDAKQGGRALRDQVTAANNILFAPESVERDVLEAARSSLTGQGTLDPNQASAIDAINDHLESLDESVTAFRSARDRMRTMLSEMDDEEEVAA